MNNASEPKYALFISYAHQDLPFVDELVSHLEDHRLNVWVDQGILRLGDSFSNSVQEALEHSKYFLLVISPSYLKSAWGNFEMGVALSRAASPANGKIIPLVVGEVNRAALPPLIAQTKPILIGENVSFDKLAEDLTAIIERGEQEGRVIEKGTSCAPSYSA
jgi:hypothetical protein